VGKKEDKMATRDKSFEDLVKEAPAAPPSGAASLVGTLSRSHEAGKFVLTLQDGRAVTLNTADVKDHAVLGTSVGQTIVRVDVDASKVPALNPQPLPPSQLFTNPDVDHPFTYPVWRDTTVAWWDHHHTPLYFDYTVAWFDQGGKSPIVDPQGTGFADQLPPGNTLAEGIPDPTGGITPFAMATPHQAPAGALGGMTPGPQTVYWLDTPRTVYWLDHTAAALDQKRPEADGTFPGHPHSDV
jgi:hypothetical protein